MGNLLPDTLGLLAGACAFALAFGIAFVAIRAYESFQKECFGNGGGGAALGVGESMLLGLVRRALLVPVSPVNARFVAKRFYAPVSTLLRRAGYPGEITALEVAGLMELGALVIGELRLGKTREEALRNLAARVEIVSLTTFVQALVHADRMGTPLGKVLRILSTEMRVARTQRAEKLANEAPVKLLFPLIACIFPTIFLMLFGPIAYEVLF